MWLRQRTIVLPISAAMAMVALIVVSASGPIRLWDTPAASTGRPPVESIDPSTLPPTEVAPDAADGSDAAAPTIVQVLGIAVILALLAAVASTASRWTPAGGRALSALRRRRVPVLADVDEAEFAIDDGVARRALSGGTPRNAIVACWQHLESAAEARGLPRRPAETSAEYVARVIATTASDTGPIEDLAALYREARFSEHELGEDHRARAADALDRVVASLPRVDVVG